MQIWRQPPIAAMSHKKGAPYQALRYSENGGFDLKTAVPQYYTFMAELYHAEQRFFLFRLSSGYVGLFCCELLRVNLAEVL